MKKLLLLNLVLVFTWYSCVEETQVTRKDQLVIKSQAWFAQNLNSKIWDKKQSLIDWGRASLITTSTQKEFVAVPFKSYKVYDGSNFAVARNLLFQVENKNIVTAQVLDIVTKSKSALPSYESLVLNNFEENMLPGFTGEIFLHSLEFDLTFSKSFKQGKNMGRAKIVPKENTNARVSDYWCNDFYMVEHWGSGVEVWTYMYTTCEVIGDGGAGGGGGGGDPFWNGGLTTLKTCEYGYCIQNQLTNPCLSTTANGVLNPDLISNYNSIIQNIFNSNDKVNLVLRDDLPLASNVTGNTPLPTINGEILNVTVYLNPNLLGNSSQEFIASTIYHEAFHAIIHYLDSDNWFFETNTTIDEQHYMMFTTSLNRLTNALQASFPSLGSDAIGLMLKGLAASGLPQVYINRILLDNNLDASQVKNISDKYSNTGTFGIRCN